MRVSDGWRARRERAGMDEGSWWIGCEKERMDEG